MGFSLSQIFHRQDYALNESMHLSEDDKRTIQMVERIGASLSLAGVCLIFLTFWLFKRLRTVPHTFILFASIANVGASVACLIGYSGLSDDEADSGEHSPLCQTQAFLLEMFMQSDPWWSLAMAVNVFLVFFRAANPMSFRRYLWIYCLVCFGMPAVPAVACLFIYTEKNGWVYGNATLWCWISDSWNSLRIFTYYLPIWLCILLSAAIYFAVGYQVFHQRNQLRNLTLSTQAKEISTSDVRDSAEKSQHHPPYYGTVTTEVQITAEASDSRNRSLTPSTSIGASSQLPQLSPLAPLHPWRSPDEDTITTSPTLASVTAVPFATVSTVSSTPTGATSGERGLFARTRIAWQRFIYKLRHLDPVKLAYLRTSFVFAISVLVTWTPSSINRVYNLLHPDRFSFGLNMASAVVLPLQGVWNAVIFCATSWAVLREELLYLAGRHRLLRRGMERLGSKRIARLPSHARAADAFRGGPIDEHLDVEMTTPPRGKLRVVRGGSL